MALKLLKQTKCFDGVVKHFAHESAITRMTMQFCVFLPKAATDAAKVPAIYYLAGLTCNEELMQIKGGAQRMAAKRGVALITPDTSPRGINIEGDSDHWDFGTGAGFYVDAKEPKWAENYNMYSYVTKELPALVTANLPIIDGKQSIMGHSMGGHGALTLALKNPDLYKSVSAFAPICHPTQCPWGIKAFTGYLGTDQSTWKAHDATLLVLEKGANPNLNILIDQGTDDQFLADKQLLPEAFEAACQKVGQPLTLRMQDGYDHGYYFVSTFMEDHINHHADVLLATV
ncbi:S-formylglutathione hydrolase [Saprolegnia diclina VS20]|uniref:S-formylglutathione hydrolase n=1 Tax=Saprolegnia diclina (strain VS20) TaxID=1156394 RepID=T0PL68_SAPDV|nr:S-formylglutathione hydrolase [Saprolegnia diclina VS20]EQC26129.1 S-formylglutathione hydrolase [Saprolegnia diclina VS20]|eukprot:XP_008620431.1 S-formylglutathione hydrolase [Saprolegnia diclina VS20]